MFSYVFFIDFSKYFSKFRFDLYLKRQMIFYIFLITNYVITKSEPLGASDTTPYVTASHLSTNYTINMLTTTKPKPKEGEINITGPTRRIIDGRFVGDTRPYMVYLRAAVNKGRYSDIDVETWLCGGAIIHERYILTSAACIENAVHFYVVSGTHKWHKGTTNNVECINNGAKKAVWKCVPKSYVYDGQEFDNIRWMVNDIAVVKVEDEFNFEKRIKGCDFIPQKVAFNNVTLDHEKPNNYASIAGWGSKALFSDLSKMTKVSVIPPTDDPNEDNDDKRRLRDGFEGLKYDRAPENSPDLLETEVVILSKKSCKKRWPLRYHYIVDRHMICGKDSTDADNMSKACSEHEVDCKELLYSQESEEGERRSGHKRITGRVYVNRRAAKSGKKSGGFCENDHGGPLVVGYGKTSIVIGIISACLINEITYRCHGPFLYTSVYNNRDLISCAIDKEMGQTCKALLRTSKTQMQETNFIWANHPHGPAKSERAANTDDEEENDDDDARKKIELKSSYAESREQVPAMQIRSNQEHTLATFAKSQASNTSPGPNIAANGEQRTTQVETTTDELNAYSVSDDET